MNIRKGIKLIEEESGDGPAVERHNYYLMAIRITLNQGDVVGNPEKCLGHKIDEFMKIEDDGYFQHRVRIDRENMVNGLFYAVQGMNVGGYRKVSISPHLAYGDKGIPDVIPPNAKLIAEIKVLKKVSP